VSRMPVKQVPLRLAPRDYEELREQVLRRDAGRCQTCGSMSNLEVHHQEYRSHSGEDRADNLITLCHVCHRSMHESTR
jgi:5-methylcytosine-specific restriction endonuclease McrA